MPRKRAIVGAHDDLRASGANFPALPSPAFAHRARPLHLVYVDAVEAALLEQPTDRMKMRKQALVAGEDGKSFRHEEGHVEGALGNRELIDLAAIKAQRETARLAPPGRDHG